MCVPRATVGRHDLPYSGDEIDWRGVEIDLVDTGYTTHPVFGPWEAEGQVF